MLVDGLLGQAVVHPAPRIEDVLSERVDVVDFVLVVGSDGLRHVDAHFGRGLEGRRGCAHVLDKVVLDGDGNVSERGEDRRFDGLGDFRVVEAADQNVHDPIAIGRKALLERPADVAQDAQRDEAGLPFAGLLQALLQEGVECIHVPPKVLASDVGERADGEHGLLWHVAFAARKHGQQGLHDAVGVE